MLGSLMKIFIDSSDEFTLRQADLISSGVSERCLCGAFMLIINDHIQKSQFCGYYTDIEYNRNGSMVKTIIDDELNTILITCDLIVHSRGTNPFQDNLIALEMKRVTHSLIEKEKDKARLIALTKPDNESAIFSLNGGYYPIHVCGYVLGVYYEIDEPEGVINIEYYVNGRINTTYVKRYR
jgi:hypothetical protein